MNPGRFGFFMLLILALIAVTSCAAPATEPPVDMVGTLSMQIAIEMLTLTAGASTSTPPPPEATFTPSFTETPAGTPTETPRPRQPAVVAFAGCYTGPGETFTLISNIDPSIRNSGRQVVTILGMGSEAGWIVIRNPYFNNPCWIRTEFLDIDPLIDLSQYPMMTPAAR